MQRYDTAIPDFLIGINDILTLFVTRFNDYYGNILIFWI